MNALTYVNLLNNLYTEEKIYITVVFVFSPEK
jgi:hypothetical protein